MQLNVSSAKWRPLSLGLNVLSPAYLYQAVTLTNFGLSLNRFYGILVREIERSGS